MEERIHPKMVVDYHLARRGIALEQVGVGEVVVLTWGKGVVLKLAEATGAVETGENWLYPDRAPMFNGQIDGRRVSYVRVPVGAPATVMVMDEMIACGAHTFIGIGWAGGLQPDQSIGSLILPMECISEEGTSGHYLPGDRRFTPDGGLADLLESCTRGVGLDARRGLHWTTDAPYRELKSKIEAYRQQGVLGVDMETSAMYALGQFRGVRVCNLLVISDEVHGEWNPAFGKEILIQATLATCEAVLQALYEGMLWDR